MDNISQSIHKINEMYTDLTYFDQYGGSIFIFIVNYKPKCKLYNTAL